MRLLLGSEAVRDAAVNILTTACEVDAWGCAVRGVTELTEEDIIRGSKHRTLENSIRRDVTGTYKRITVGYELLDYSRYQMIRKIWQNQCDGLACITLSITNPCQDLTCDCQEVTPVEVMKGTLDIGKGNWDTNGRYVTGFDFVFESSQDCAECSSCG